MTHVSDGRSEAPTAPSTAVPPAIELHEVSKSYDGAVAVDRMSLAVQPGEFVTLLGPSGSGKTTTMMMVAGFEDPSSGRISIDGRPVDGLPAKNRNLGVVFQSYALFPHLSARQNVEFPLRMRGVSARDRRTAAHQALERVGLAGLEERLPRQLSGGQQQRVALARALVFKPAALLLDEPMAALDRRLRETMQREIKEIQQSLGIAVVFVTHDQAEAMAMSDRIVVMRAGQVVQTGTPEDVYLHPSTDWIANFLGDTNLFPCELLSRSAPTAVVDAGRFGVIEVTDRRGSDPSAARYAVSVRPEHVEVRPWSAEGAGAEGVLVGSTHLGPTVRHAVQVGAQAVVSLELSGDGEDNLRAGDAVRVGWKPGRAQLLSVGD